MTITILTQVLLSEEEFVGISVTPEEDGLYKTYTIVLDETYSNQQYFYIFDSTTNTLYKRINGSAPEEVDINELYSVNSTNTNITSRLFTYNIIYDSLYSCYVNITTVLLRDCNSRCGNKLDQNLVYKRDLLWMTISVIQYLIAQTTPDYIKAGNILNKFIVCNGFCKSLTTNNNCGCNGRS